tara:strand:+ start:2219 stop:3895 length:1677 start_codon:yes stop_codon:yes gene_type:complete
MADWIQKPKYILGAFIVLCFVLRLNLIFVYEINWDEFLNLSMVHDFLRGDLREPLQTIFIQAFRWLPSISANEVDQIIAGRMIVYLMGVGTALFIYLVSRRYMGITAALFAVLSYISFSLVIRQGMSFRTDPMATFLLMGAIWALVCHSGRLGFAILGGFLIALAGMVTIKSIFYVPAIGIILLTQIYFSENRMLTFAFASIATIAALVSFAVLYLFHQSTLSDPASALAFLDRTTGKTLGERDFSAAQRTFSTGLVYNLVFWVAAAIGLFEAIKKIGAGPGAARGDAIITASLALILLSLFLYTESYVYYYTFMLAPVAVLCGLGFASLSGKSARKIGFVAGILLGVGFLGQYVQAVGRTNHFQHEIVEVVHRAFPEPVPYIDRASMISSYPKKSIFMSSWGMADYYAKDERIMRGILEGDQPPFLIANRRMLALDRLEEDEFGPEHLGFFREDRDILQDNYIRHWGPIFVAGKRFVLDRDAASKTFEILVAGEYQLQSVENVVIDGQILEPGGTLDLAQGAHQITVGKAGEYVLRWGHNLYKPSGKSPDKPVFTDF